MTFELKYTADDGEQKYVRLKDHAVNINLSGANIESIDLSQLPNFPSLKILNLSHNKLRQIDLSPLILCLDFQVLILAENELRTIDLSPLGQYKNLQTLVLGANTLWSIDLAPLSSCDSLQTLDVTENHLRSIELSPLSSCTSLHQLYLRSNNLQSINLTPLSKCVNMETIDLSSNEFHTIDLKPLSSCAHLESLWLSENQFRNIDLSPLASCTSLQTVGLFGNPLHSIDITPLAINFLENRPNISGLRLNGDRLRNKEDIHSWLIHEEAVYQPPAVSYPWFMLHSAAEQQGLDRRVQQDILFAMGLKGYGFIDCEITNILLAIPEETPFEIAREYVIEALVDEIVRSADRGGSTIGLKIEELLSKHDELAKRAKRIVEIREAEMHRIIIGVRGIRVDLRELWLTAYGYEILSALGMPLSTNLKGFEKVKASLAELGFELKTGEKSVSGVKMSKDLKKAIWWIVKNRGRPWSDIEDGNNDNNSVDPGFRNT